MHQSSSLETPTRRVIKVVRKEPSVRQNSDLDVMNLAHVQREVVVTKKPIIERRILKEQITLDFYRDSQSSRLERFKKLIQE
jgi:hypothetical protein